MEVFPMLLGQKPQILFDIVTYFLADAVAEYKKLGSLEQQKGLNTQLRSLEVQSAGRQGRAALSALRRPSSPLPAGLPSWQTLARSRTTPGSTCVTAQSALCVSALGAPPRCPRTTSS